MSEYSTPLNFIDLAAQQARIRDRIEKAIMNVLDHGQYIMGPEVSQFEQELVNFTCANHAISCANGTDALSIVMMAWGSGPEMQFLFLPSPMLPQLRRLPNLEPLHFLWIYRKRLSI